MPAIPSAVLSDTVRELLSGRRVTAAAFMTYTLEPQFFEEEILPLLTDEAVSIQAKCRMVQMEEVMRSKIGPVAVYYDHTGLRQDGAARLDVRYKPIHISGGIFHPKVVLLLTEPESSSHTKAHPALICGILSANLTKSAWWSCLECAHFETVNAGVPCSFRGDLRRLIEDVLKLGANNGPHEALESILSFVKALVRDDEQAARARLRPRISAGRNALGTFLREARGDALDGKTLEIISPFFDNENANVLQKLTEELQVRRTFVFLPRTADGVSSCTNEYYDDLNQRPRTKWAQIRGEDSLLRLGKDKNAKRRSVHAKVYRFTSKDPPYEALVVGSHNLTSPALSRGGNFEASFFLEVEPKGRIESWLAVDDDRPALFSSPDPLLEAETDVPDVVIPLQVRFNWTEPRSSALLWEGATASPELRLSLAGAHIVTRGNLPPGEWVNLQVSEVEALGLKLISSALLTVHRNDDRSADLLVQEYGMAAKPSILLTWTPTEVLAYWSSLSTSQRIQYLETRVGTNELDAAMKAEWLELSTTETETSIFDSFAGIFHGFEMLREQVVESVKSNRISQAEYLLFGNRHDSLPTLLGQIEKNADSRYDAVTRYLYVMSAQQVIASVRSFLREDYSEVLEGFKIQFRDLQRRTHFSKTIRQELSLGEGGEAFLDWFDENFRARVQPSVATVP